MLEAYFMMYLSLQSQPLTHIIS